MKIEEFALAATTNSLTREPEARGVADLLEFRMDKAEEPIEQLSDYEGELPIIATNRTMWFGGKADDTGRLDRLFAASRFDAVELVDVELETARSKDWMIEELRDNDVQVIISHHDFEDTPEQPILDRIFEQCAEYGDIAKVATFPQDYDDTLTLLNAIKTGTARDHDVAGIAMGEVGSHTRIIAHLYGSKLGYAPLAADETDYAPGQIPLEQLASLVECTKNESVDIDSLESIDGDFDLARDIPISD